ncbi:RNA polymerase sigma factor [Streptomyces sp. NPDC053079]|uniref:RNA polymerase sigma factor n=1 Tax=Streptomyces sp. NPDC053079 TaxID=3365697 RepID=UPI0037D1C3BF
MFAWDDALEAANISLFRIFARWDAVLASDSIDAFAFKILKDAVVDVLRTRDRRPLPLAALEETVRPIAGIPHDEAEQAALRLDVHRAIAALPDRQRTCVFLHHIFGSPIPEIADTTGLATSTVRSHLTAGRAALAAALRDGPAAKGTS